MVGILSHGVKQGGKYLRDSVLGAYFEGLFSFTASQTFPGTIPKEICQLIFQPGQPIAQFKTDYMFLGKSNVGIRCQQKLNGVVEKEAQRGRKNLKKKKDSETPPAVSND